MPPPQPDDRLASLFQSSSIPMYIVDPVSLRFLEVNDAMVRLYGWTRAEFLATTTAIIRRPEDVPALRVAMAKALAGEDFRSLWRHLRKDGTILDVQVYPHRLLFGGEPALFAMLFDVTERLRVEEALRLSEERYRTVARATSDAVWDLDLLTDDITWNESFTNLFGFSTDEMRPALGWWAEQVHPEDRDRVLVGLQSAIDGGASSWEDEYRFRRANGVYAAVLDRGVILRNAHGIPVRAVGAMVDVTAQREMQARLALANRMASVGTLAAGVAHEINNPLGWILANLDEAITGLRESADARLANTTGLLLRAREGAERVRSIVRDLGAFSRPAESDASEAVDLRAVVESAAAMTSNEIRHRARLVLGVPADLPPVLGDSSRLGQVFVNLLVNAAHAIPEGDAVRHEIRVTAGREGPASGGSVWVEVADSGPGIPADVLPRIFDPFFTTKRVGEGTGLGLSICMGIVRGLGGEIRVDSIPGAGSRFRVVLPAAASAAIAATEAAKRAPPSDARTASEARAPGKRARVLLVDDEPLFAEAAARLLIREHDVEVVNDGREALRRLRAGERYDLIVCDLMMPDMTGMALHDELKSSAPEQRDRMVMLTGGAFTDVARRFVENTDLPTVEKAFATEQLLRAVRARLASLSGKR